MARTIIHHEANTIRGCMALVPPAIADLTPEQSVFRCEGRGSHIVWNVGHLIWSLSEDVGVTMGLASDIPDRYHSLFATGSQPLADATACPSIAELIAQTSRVTARVTDYLETFDDDALATVLPPTSPLGRIYPNWLELVASTGFHVGYHLGQIGLLRRAQGLSRALDA